MAKILFFFHWFFQKKKKRRHRRRIGWVSHSVIRVANLGGGIIRSKPFAFALCITAISPFSSKPPISICTSKTPLDSRKNRNRSNPYAPTNKKSSSSLLLLLLIPPFRFSPNFIRDLKWDTSLEVSKRGMGWGSRCFVFHQKTWLLRAYLRFSTRFTDAWPTQYMLMMHGPSQLS